MKLHYKVYVKITVVGLVAYYTWKEYGSVAKILSNVPVAGKLFK